MMLVNEIIRYLSHQNIIRKLIHFFYRKLGTNLDSWLEMQYLMPKYQEGNSQIHQNFTIKTVLLGNYNLSPFHNNSSINWSEDR